MIHFAHRNYKKYNPRIYKNWIKAINKEIEYCKTITNPLEFRGKCKAINLVSEHPYWQLVSLKNGKKFVKSIKQEIEDNKQLLEVNPNHHYRCNILSNINRLETIINNYETTL